MKPLKLIAFATLLLGVSLIPRLASPNSMPVAVVEASASQPAIPSITGFPTGADGDWQLNGTLTDSGSGGNSLTVIGTTIYTNSNTGFYFNGATTNDLSVSTIGNDTSMAASIYWCGTVNNVSAHPVLVSHGTFSSSGWYLQVNATGAVVFHIGRSTAPSDQTITTANIISNGTTNGFMVVLNGTSGIIYVNGTNAASATGLSAMSSDSHNLRLGNYSAGANPLTGAVFEVTHWPRSLSSVEVGNANTSGPQ